jgi:hypothetical protein
MYQEYNSTKWMFKRGQLSNRMLDLKHDKKSVFFVEKVPPGDRFRFYMAGKNGNIGLGDLATVNVQTLMLTLYTLRSSLNMNSNNGFHIQISPNLLLNFSPNDARIIISNEQNATFCILAAFVIASKMKRVL